MKEIKIKKEGFYSLDYNDVFGAIYIPEKKIILSRSGNIRLVSKKNTITDIKQIFFYGLIQGHRCDRCTIYDDVEDRINIKEIKLDFTKDKEYITYGETWYMF